MLNGVISNTLPRLLVVIQEGETEYVRLALPPIRLFLTTVVEYVPDDFAGTTALRTDGDT